MIRHRGPRTQTLTLHNNYQDIFIVFFLGGVGKNTNIYNESMLLLF